MRLLWVVSCRGLGVRQALRGGLIAAVLLSCLFSLWHLSSVGLPDGDFITLKGRSATASFLGAATKAGTGAAAAVRSSLSISAGRGGGSSSSSLVHRNALLAAWPPGKPRGAIVVLSRNIDLGGVVYSMEQLEKRFNSDPRHHYPYIFLNDQPHTPKFQAGVAAVTSAPCLFGTVPMEHWSYPDFVDQDRAAAARKNLEDQVPYGGSESYRHMCRFFSGFFFRHPLLDGFEYYWRMEPAVSFICNIQQDPFRYMKDHNISYGWNIIVNEVMATIPTLWDTVRDYLRAHPTAAAPNNSLPALVYGEGQQSYYSGCHFWSNFEIGRLSFFRSEAYLRFFNHLDRARGFFYERWGDAPVHSLAAALLLPRTQLHRFNDIGYQHNDWLHCPQEPAFRYRCDCDTTNDVNIHQSGCLDTLRATVGIY